MQLVWGYAPETPAFGVWKRGVFIRQRNRRFSLWLNDEEFDRLEKDANIAGLKKEPYIRKLIMGNEIRPRPPDEFKEILRELSAIGNNVNQLAYKANGLGTIYINEVQSVREALNNLYREVKKV